MSHRPSSHSERPDPRVLRPVRQIALAGLALVLVWPAARGYSE
ncbi:membrane protein, partial [Xanthomonas vasicola pv. musacearum NCPPB 4384]